ncbi:S-layer homology domain-containing protein [Ellagibacter isourolithinifaciens]|uniref:S-layer homology domain-containing protein n=1 Tax=Ellagibacter isourolithinifaciens TaxID=2137581 RepID=UPI003A8D04F9
MTAATNGEGTAIDTAAAFTLGDTANAYKATQVTTGTGVVIDAVNDVKVATVEYKKAEKDGSLAKNYTPAADKTTQAAFPTEAGTYYAIVKVTSATGKFADYANAWVAQKITVASKSLADAVAYEVQTGDKKDDLSDTTFTYNGYVQNVGFKLGDKALVPYDSSKKTGDYTVAFLKPNSASAATVKNAGTYTAVLTGENDYKGQKVSVNVTVDALDLSNATIVLNDMTSSAAKDYETATIKSINGKAADEAVTDQLEIAFTSGPEGSYITEAKAGTYNYSITVPQVGGKDNANITGSATASVDKVGAQAAWTYDGQIATVESTSDNDGFFVWSVDHSKTEDDDGYKEDFDLSKLVARGGTKKLAYDYTVTDEDGNEATAADLSKAGTWIVTATVDSAANEYAFGGTLQAKVIVSEGTIDAAKSVYLMYDGKLATKTMSDQYDGTDKLAKFSATIKAGDKTLVEGTDYTVKVTNKAGKEVTEAVDVDEYTITIKAPAYGLTETATLDVTAIAVNDIRVANTTKLVKDGKTTEFLPYTGEAIEPVIEYLVNPAEAKGTDGKIDAEKAEWKTLPAELYNLNLKWTSKDGKTANKSVTEIKDLGDYAITLTKLSKADEAKNYNIDVTKATTTVTVSDAKYFLDVTVNDWFYESVNKAAELDYMNGYVGTTFFGPSDEISRGQVACVLFNMAGGTLDSSDFEYDNNDGYASFADVDGSQYYAKAVAWAKAAGVVNGYDDGTFRPENSITREEFAAMLANYAKKVGNFEASDGSALAALPDADQVSGWAKESVAWAVENGIMGNGGVVNPAAKITRAEAAAMAVNYQPKKLA